MRRSTAVLGSVLFFVVAPCTVAGLVPWLLTGWHAGGSWWPPVRVVGVVLVAVGAAVLLHSFARFVTEGLGTPAPVAEPEHLVVGGLFRYVRNPMYVAVTAVVTGQALLLCRWDLLGYAAVALAVMVAFVRLYEEPHLRARFGAEYDVYRREVPGWWPRLRPARRR
ncbi:methyltransferase family protein [Catellatospora tritici]|uniref:methyltransferase family protein n=1 Tax=Catellatospora tritici TaxID=2851566 RepID=UPI001C2CD2AE|nr:isoprenylcysteine carboxylmethyltransferase family protein [Catellatospora tritici]MBV1851556.1 isoprenylcysteine carboxylmethyltransferase family protein [Catellatospora tritici]